MNQTESWSSEWRRDYGQRWAAKLVLLGLLLAARGALDTLSDADLPMHLAIGEWIVRHGALPTVEPFAWTRAGAPFYAYSWAMDVAMYKLAQSGGAFALRILQGLMMAGAFGSMIVLGRAAKWDPRTSLLMGIANVFVLTTIASSVRPQTILFVLIPLGWAFTYFALYSPRPRAPIVGLLIASAIAANTHIFFFLTAAPWLLWIADPPRERQRILSVVGATLLGWVLTPYLLSMPELLRFSFQSNILLAPPTPVKEAAPGFIAMGEHWALVPLALFLASLPLLLTKEWPSRSWRFAGGLVWLVGLVAFAIGSRLLLVWWLLTLPLAGLAVQNIARFLMATEDQGRRLWRITAVWAVCTLLILSVGLFDDEAWRFEDPVAARRLAPTQQRGLEPIARWLDCNTRNRSRGRVYTIFNYGSALTWRLPNYSMSIDGRTIFPDSVAKAEVYLKPLRDSVTHGPWKSADLAIIPVNSTVREILKSAAGWREVAISERSDTGASLWVKESWWKLAGIAGLPAYPLSLRPSEQKTGGETCNALALAPPHS